ncbi:MAG TPA: Rieske (2Fe-2S) protein [Chloroflexota bacterium]|nr:Rieske (2Fe-2S) protein [Chloroflexota bacterium]
MTGHDAGAAGFAVGELRGVEVGGRRLVVGRNDAGYFALTDICPHQGSWLSTGTLGGTAVASVVGEIEYGRDGLILRCPWHGWEFDVESGRSLCEPDRRWVAAYAVKEENGRLLVSIG